MMNSNITHDWINAIPEEPLQISFDDYNNFSPLVQAETFPSMDAASYYDNHSVFYEPAALWWRWKHGWGADRIRTTQPELCIDPRLTIGNPRDSLSGSDHGTHRHDTGNKQANDVLHQTSGLNEGSIDGGLATTFVERNLEVNPDTTKGGPSEVTRSAKSGGKWRSGAGPSEEMPHEKRPALEYATPTKRTAGLSQTKSPRAGVIWVRKDDGQEPDLERDSLGYAVPTAVLDRLARGGLKVEYWDRVFFPESEKHTKCPTRGHICRVQMKIVKPRRGQAVWAPVGSECRPQKSAESYRRHLLNCHLATPRGIKKRSNIKAVEATRNTTGYDMEYTPQCSTEGSRVGKRKRPNEDDGTSQSQGGPSARNHWKRQRTA